MKINDFDNIAWIYDALSKLIFGNSIRRAQSHYLHELPPCSNILILGGGTGWHLNEITTIHPTAKICHIEASGQMLERSKVTAAKSDCVEFIHGTESNIPAGSKFNVVITNFYLDLFTPKSLHEVINKINIHTTPDTRWFVSDFINPEKWWQKLLMKLMYLFFRITTNIEASALPEWSKLLADNGWIKKSNAMFYYDFIESCYFENYQANKLSW